MADNVVQLSDFTYRAVQSPESSGAVCLHGDWTNSELAQLYRIETALLQARIPVLTERGVTDEDDPWFSFIRQDGQVVVHIARYDGQYHLVSPALPRALTGSSFADLTKHFAQEVPAMAMRSSSAAKSESHPVVLFTLMVAAIFFALDQIAGGEAVAHPLDERQAMPQSDSAVGPPPIAPRSEEAPQRSTAARAAEVWSNPSNVQAWSLVMAVVLGAAIGSVADATAAENWVEDRGGLVAVGEAGAFNANSDPGFLDRVAEETVLSQDSSSLGDLDEATEPNKVFSLDFPQPASLGTGPAARPSDQAVTDAQGRLGSSQVLPNLLQSVKLAAATAPPGSVPLQVSVADGCAIYISGDVSSVIVTVSGSGGSIDVSAADGLASIEVQGLGALSVLNVPMGSTPQIEISSGSEVALTLVFEGAVSGPPQPTATSLRLDGGTSVDLTLQKAYGANSDAAIDLTVASVGLEANTLSMVSDETDVPAHLKLIGDQDLLLQQTAASFSRDVVDASLFSGELTLGINLGAAPSEFFSLTDKNIVSTDMSSVGLVVTASSAEFGIGVDLQKLLITGASQTAGSSTFLELSLDGGDDGVEIGVLTAGSVQRVELISRGEANTINLIDTPLLSSLVLSGEAALSIRNVFANRGEVAAVFEVDAGAMSGDLAFSFGSSPVSFSRVTIIGGDGDDVLSVASLDGPVVLSGGGGLNRFEVKQGSTQAVITDLKTTDTIVVGNGSSAISTITNATSLSAEMQAAIDGSVSLTAAAAIAFGLLQTEGLHGAVLFNYDGGTYVGIDAGARSIFDSGQDTVIQLTGIPADLSLNSILLVA